MSCEDNALVALGSNTGFRESTLRSALTALQARIGCRVTASSFFETEPVGMQEGARSVVNAACRFKTDLEPAELLRVLQELEAEAGRERLDERGSLAGDRTLDLDLLLLGRRIEQTPDLTLPHPQLHRRAFVLVPACEIAEGWTHPTLNECLADLLAALPPSEVAQVCAGRRQPRTAPDVSPKSIADTSPGGSDD